MVLPVAGCPEPTAPGQLRPSGASCRVRGLNKTTMDALTEAGQACWAPASIFPGGVQEPCGTMTPGAKPRRRMAAQARCENKLASMWAFGLNPALPATGLSRIQVGARNACFIGSILHSHTIRSALGEGAIFVALHDIASRMAGFGRWLPCVNSAGSDGDGLCSAHAGPRALVRVGVRLWIDRCRLPSGVSWRHRD